MNEEDQLEELLKELGIELKINPGTEIEAGTSQQSTDLENKSITVWQPFHPDNGEFTQNIEKERLLPDGSQVSVYIRKRPICPSCGYVPTQEGEPGHLVGRCIECGTQTCPRCKNTCEACGRILCGEHTAGHGAVDETYCHIHTQDVDDQIRHERQLDRRQQNRQDRSQELEHQRQLERIEKENELKKKKHQWKQEKEKRKIELERQSKRFENRLKAKKLLIQAIKAKKQAEKSRSFKDKKNSGHIQDIKDRTNNVYNSKR